MKIRVLIEFKVSSKRRKKIRVNHKPWFSKENEKLRKEYFKIKNRYRKQRTSTLNGELKTLGKQLKRLNSKCRRQYSKEFQKKLRNLKKANSKEYWAILNSNEKKREFACKVTTEAFMEHFKKLSKKVDTGDENESNFDPRTIDHSINEYINRPFEEKEVLEQIKKLKNNKASGIDQVINKFIKNSPDNMVHLIVKILNIVLETGIIPTD